MPHLLEGDFFHSLELFQILEKTPGITPFMAVATQENKVVGQMLVILYHRKSLFPPYLYTHAHAYGEGLYALDAEQNAIFPLLLRSITIHLHKRLCFYIEFSRMSKKMLGYREFRKLGYVPIAWQEIHNSLHSKLPQERLSDKQIAMIEKMKKKGISCREATSPEDIHRYHQLLKNYYRLKLRRFVPDETFFQKLSTSSNARNVIITYKDKVIGGYTCIYNQGNAFLWFSAFKRKTYIHLHPNTMTIWQALSDAQEQDAQHLHFMDAGLPLKSNLYREFILGFEVTTMGGRKSTGIDAIWWVKRAQELGAGEILLNSMDADGTQQGFDLEMIKAVRKEVKIPIIASGGAGKASDFPPAIEAGADAVLAASIFHYGKVTIGEVKDAIKAAGYTVR